MSTTTKLDAVLCPRCKCSVDAEISEPWSAPATHDTSGEWVMVEWVQIRPHLHGRTNRSTCKPKPFGRRVKATT